jgi:hypothetical protein
MNQDFMKFKFYILITIILLFPGSIFPQVWTESVIDSFRAGIGVDSLNISFYSDDQDNGSIFLAPATENFALGKAAWDNDDDPQTNPNNVLDGKIATFWYSKTPFRQGMWIAVDLEATRTIERVNILGSTVEPQLKYIKGYSIDVSLNNTNWTRVAQNLDNKDFDVYEAFNPTTARYVRITIEKSDNVNWTFIGEVQVFGSGYASSGKYISQIKDFGSVVNFGRASWVVSIPPETRLSLQFRSDSTFIEVETYMMQDTVRLNNKYIMAQTEKVTNSDGTVTYTRNLDYIINYEKGEIVRTLSSTILMGQEIKVSYHTWSNWTESSMASDGFLFKTLEPRRYLQYRVNFETFSLETPIFHEISIEYSKQPVLHRAVATVIPKEVPVLKQATITYLIETTFFPDVDLGIDTLKIDTPASAEVLDVRLDGNPVNYIDLTDPKESELIIFFPNRISPNQSSFLEVDFSIVLFENENFFPSLIASAQTPNNPQFVEEGLDRWRVVTTGIPESPLVSVEAMPNPMTPNGDNVCDFTEIRFFVAKIATSRHVKINIYNLNGDLVRHLLDTYSVAKDFLIAWDGKDQWGNLVLPGVYIYQVSVDTDSGEYVTTKTITVVY